MPSAWKEPKPSPQGHLSATVGIVGFGALGGAIGRRLVRSGVLSPDRLVIANRSGRAEGFEPDCGVRITTDILTLAGTVDAILFALPPSQTAGLSVPASNALVMSVMAGVRVDRLVQITGSARVIRAMSNPAAEIGLAYSPWYAADGVTARDRTVARTLFEGCGITDEVPDEAQIDIFTALTGPVPGFVAYFAECMAAYARDQGVAPALAERAVRQLFRASGELLTSSDVSPADHVEAMVRYAGTTAAGLLAMRASSLQASVAEGLDAATRKAREIAPGN